MSRAPTTLCALADGIWIDTAPARVLGMHLTATMAVLRLGDDALMLYSPLAMTPERRAAIDALGMVTHLYAPNLYHHLHIGEWAGAYASACVHAPAGLAKKRPDLRIDRTHGTGAPAAFEGVVDEMIVEGFRLEETVIVHRPSRTLIVADLVHNIGRPPHWWARVYASAMGFYDRVALSGMIRTFGFSDRAAARASVDRLAAAPFDRIVVGHGAVVEVDAKKALVSAFAWLAKR